MDEVVSITVDPVDPTCKLTLDSIKSRMRVAHGGRDGNRATMA